MELFDRLEALDNRITDLLLRIEELREENRTLRETAIGLADLREIDGRIDALLARIREHMTEEEPGA